MEALPSFKYHPDPIKSGSVVASDTVCKCCVKARGYVYAGPVYAEADGLDDSLCPWCIADGSAAKKFDAIFVDDSIFPDEVTEAVAEEVSQRTPSYSSWQTEEWPACCSDATAFLGPVGFTELQRDFPDWESDVTHYIVDVLRVWNNEALQMLRSLNISAGPTAYLFECSHCGSHHVYLDSP